ncbi:NAD(P)-dependent dehydrogenase (short-subunit alcohol dehydrogenase family) [Chitinophaga sp. W3I9]|uniref:SDR family oxidoreductase n=1 Tax=unclassified Chitinophaga TaxID=2619133 RepID=UPI003D24AE8C
MKTIFITGASTGLGKATARLFQSKGWQVIATMRKPENETELSQLENVILLPLDVTNTEQINDCVKNVTAKYDVDVVLNNAGYGLMGALDALSDEQIVKQLNTNLLGVIRVTKAFIPFFREKKQGLFITITSIGGLVGFPLGSTYHATKWALEGWSESLSYELSLHNIGIKTVAPGGIVTDFAGRSLEMGSHPAYEDMMQKVFALFDPEAFSTADEIAGLVYEAATDGQNKITYVGGEYANALYNRRLEIGKEAARIELGKSVLGN